MAGTALRRACGVFGGPEVHTEMEMVTLFISQENGRQWNQSFLLVRMSSSVKSAHFSLPGFPENILKLFPCSDQPIGKAQGRPPRLAGWVAGLRDGAHGTVAS